MHRVYLFQSEVSQGSNPYQCNEPSCQGAKPSRDMVEVLSNFLREAISQVMSSKSIEVRYDSNTYRMVSEGSNAMRYVKHGNLEKLKTCIITGEATLWDTASDGCLFSI